MSKENTPSPRENIPAVQVHPNTPVESNKYAVLQETSGEECESWYYFIKYQGNEEVLQDLEKQLESVEWYIIDDLSTFDLEIQYLVSEQTAKEMTKIDLNSYSFHRKFDGKMRRINLGFKNSYSNEKKMTKAFDILGYGQIEDYVSDEDIDPEDLVNGSDSESDVVDASESESDSGSDEESKSPDDRKTDKKKKTK